MSRLTLVTICILLFVATSCGPRNLIDASRAEDPGPRIAQSDCLTFCTREYQACSQNCGATDAVCKGTCRERRSACMKQCR